MKKILILGAGIYQVPLIKKVKDLGHYAIVSSIPGNYPGFALADKVYYESTVDKEAILRVARTENIDAILTTGTDVAIKTIGYVCDELHLAGITKSCAEKVTNKALMKRCMVDGKVRTASFEKVHSVDEAVAVCERMEFPVMFKCVDKSGSRGIFKVTDKKDIKNAFLYAKENTQKPYIIIEKFIDGYEIGVDGYIGDGDYYIVPHDKIVYNNGATNVPIGHIFPYLCNSIEKKDLKLQIIKAANALGMKNTFFNADIMIKDGKSYIIEIGARAGGTCIPELMSIHLGVDYYGLMVANALGEKIVLKANDDVAAVGELLLSQVSGKIESIYSGEDKLGGLCQISMDYQVGDEIKAFRVGPDRIGQIIVKGNTVDDALNNLSEAKKQFKIIVK
mgnify:CR=1 FL=1